MTAADITALAVASIGVVVLAPEAARRRRYVGRHRKSSK